MGLEGGHTLQAKEISRLVAPFRARYYCPDGPQATQTSGLCTLGFVQFKADGLVEGVAKLMSLINDRAMREKLSKIINKIIIEIYFV